MNFNDFSLLLGMAVSHLMMVLLISRSLTGLGLHACRGCQGGMVAVRIRHNLSILRQKLINGERVNKYMRTCEVFGISFSVQEMAMSCVCCLGWERISKCFKQQQNLSENLNFFWHWQGSSWGKNFFPDHCIRFWYIVQKPQIMFTFTCTKTFVCKALHAGVYCAAVHQWILSALSYGRIPAETLDIMMAFWKQHCPSIPTLTIQELLVLPLPFMDVNYFHDFLSFFLQMHHGDCVSSIQKWSLFHFLQADLSFFWRDRERRRLVDFLSSHTVLWPRSLTLWQNAPNVTDIFNV